MVCDQSVSPGPLAVCPLYLHGLYFSCGVSGDIFWEDRSRLCEEGKTKAGPQCGNGSIICLERAVRQRCQFVFVCKFLRCSGGWL